MLIKTMYKNTEFCKQIFDRLSKFVAKLCILYKQ